MELIAWEGEEWTIIYNPIDCIPPLLYNSKIINF